MRSIWIISSLIEDFWVIWIEDDGILYPNIPDRNEVFVKIGFVYLNIEKLRRRERRLVDSLALNDRSWRLWFNDNDCRRFNGKRKDETRLSLLNDDIGFNFGEIIWLIGFWKNKQVSCSCFAGDRITKQDDGRVFEGDNASFLENERRVNLICWSLEFMDVERTNEFVVRIFRLNFVNVWNRFDRWNDERWDFSRDGENFEPWRIGILGEFGVEDINLI
jgi:hypothetical protein